MGSSYRWGAEPSRAEKAAETRRENALLRERAEALAARRMALADKIVLALVDRISADIIRPGPTPEERECYVMAQELREHTAHLSELVSAILKIEAGEVCGKR